jgi:hypothetical protein
MGKNQITSSMPMRIIDLFQIIHIKKQQRTGVSIAQTPGDPVFQCLDEMTAIGQSRQDIVMRHLFHLLQARF